MLIRDFEIPVMSSGKSLSYSSSSINRATRINSLESARLQQTIRYLEQAKVHQCRLINQDMRQISMSIGNIQSSSGHSTEARIPDNDSVVTNDNEKMDTIPCFMYGERIWNRRRKRFQRPISASEFSVSEWSSNCSTSDSITRLKAHNEQNKHQLSNMCEFRSHLGSQSTNETAVVTEFDQDIDTPGSRVSTPKGRVTPHQIWEDNISEVTKKILASQARVQSGTRRSVYQSSGEVFNSNSSRNVRDLLRKIRISATVESYSSYASIVRR